MRKTLLDSGWRFQQATPGVGFHRPNEPANPWRPAVVPGCVHDDLRRAGVIPDPYALEYEAGCQWVSEEDWLYRTEFEWTPTSGLPTRVLQLEGLDTVCTVLLNGREIARHDNMFLPLEVDVTDLLAEGSNTLEVLFKSAVRIGAERRAAYFEANEVAHDTNFFDERAFVRKVQCMSGWDWGPRLVSCGIWRPVKLLEFASRITSFSVFQERQPDGSFRVWSETVVEPSLASERSHGLPPSTLQASVPAASSLRLETEFDGQAFEGDFDLVVENPRLWWPRGEGEQHLYHASASLSSGDRVGKRVGLRSIRLIQEPDELGQSFEFEVNGRPIFARGANWIPNDCFPSRISREDYQQQIHACAKLNMNMLRVWGGGLYESDAFYDACDEVGILVWQDFPFSCSYYPDGPEEQQVLEREADFHVRRLRDRTSLAIWCGNNETDVMWESKWGGIEKSPMRYCGDCLYETILAEVCRRLDPARPYIRSSPIGGQAEDGTAWGDVHYWDVWHGRGDWGFYADSNTRFCSEFGFCCACGEEAWALAEVKMHGSVPDNASVRWHDKSGKPWEIYKDMVELHYPEARSLEEWIYYSQLNQRDALRFGIEHFRTNGRCRGTLIWQFNDCWPVQSWAVQDYSRRLKPAGFELERLHAPVLISLRMQESELVLLAANDAPTALQSRALLAICDADGSMLSRTEFAVDLGSGARKELGRVSFDEFDRATTVAFAEFEDDPKSRTWRTLAEPRDMRWIAPDLALSSDLTLKVDGLLYDAIVDDPDRLGNLQPAGEGLAGRSARTLCRESIKLCAEHLPKRVRIKCLGGTWVLPV